MATEIMFDALLTPAGEPLWLFVLDAADVARVARLELVRLLLGHGRCLGARTPIGLTCLARTPAIREPVTSHEPTAATAPSITFAMLSEVPEPPLLPWLDQPAIDDASLTPEQREWRADGVVILPSFLPNTVIDPYVRRREQLARPGGG
jgi:hypothetical protein